MTMQTIKVATLRVGTDAQGNVTLDAPMTRTVLSPVDAAALADALRACAPDDGSAPDTDSSEV